MTDADFMLSVLEDNKPHSTMEIIERSIRERGVGLTPHSRASDLRARGLTVHCIRQDSRGAFTYRNRPTFFYRLASSEALGLPSDGLTAPSSAAETAPGASLGARSTCDGSSVESATSVSPSPLPSQMTPATPAGPAPETRPDTLFDAPNVPSWA